MRWVSHDVSNRQPPEVAEGAFGRGSTTDDSWGPEACLRLKGPSTSADEERCCQNMCTCNKAAEVVRLKACMPYGHCWSGNLLPHS